MINHDLIEALIISEIAGDITEEERSCLNQLLAESKEAREYSNKVYKALMSDEAIRSREALSPVAPALGVVKKRISPYYIGMGIAAAILAVIVSIHYLMPGGKNIDLAAGKNDVRLAFKDGRELRLDSTVEVKRLTGVILNIKPDTLTYHLETAYNNEPVTLIVPEGKHQYFTMSDGSAISVNPGTTVRFTLGFSGSTREITVDGEAYIKAAPNDKKPFIVHTNSTTVQVLGTEFNVNSHDGQERISLVTGKVKVCAGNDSITLTPGKEVLRQANGNLTVSSFNTDEILKRQTGQFAYSHKTRQELALLIQRCYGIKVRVNGDQKMDLTGVIDTKEPVETFLDRHRMNYTSPGDSVIVIN